MERELRILFVEDFPVDVVLLKREIGKHNLKFQSLTVDKKEAYIQALEEFNPDVILSDYSLPAFDGMTALSIKEKMAPSIPFILITGAISEETAVEVMKSGADDYLIKGNITRLGTAITTAIAKKSSETKIKILTRAVEQSPMGIVITDLNSNVLFMNSRFEDITGYSREEVLCQSLKETGSAILSSERYPEILDNIFQGKEWWGECRSQRKSGDLFYQYVTVTPIHDENGKVTHFMVRCEDITEKKKINQELEDYRLHLEEMVDKRTAELKRKSVELERKNIELEKAKNKAESADRLKSAFLANLSHELRTPLNSVIGFSAILLQERSGDLNEEQKKQIGMIRTSGSHLLSLITDILDLSKIETGQLGVTYEFFNLQEILEEIHASMLHETEEKGLSLIFSYKENLHPLKSDKQRIRQIIVNLLSNAIKFTEEGSVKVECFKEDGQVKVSVSDTGIGIKEENLSKLFIPFIQIENDLIRKHPGSGLGLSISKKLAELLKGDILVKSIYGKGSNFTLCLPYQ